MTVTAWWAAMGAVSAVNVCAWVLIAAVVMRAGREGTPEDVAARRRQLVLSAVFVAVCAFRALVPRADVQRIGLVDSWISTVMVGRTVATVAELCFVAQWALLLRQIARGPHAAFVLALSRVLVPLIALAEVFSWSAVLTTNYLGNVLEESTWTLVSALLVLGLGLCLAEHRGRARVFLGMAVLTLACYFTFMVSVDVPMYLSRWVADEAAGRAYLSPARGLADAMSRVVVTQRWEDWRQEMPWMSLYFSLGVWMSLALAVLPFARATAARVVARPSTLRPALARAQSSAQVMRSRA